MSSKLQWGIIGTGNIAKAFALGLKGSTTGELLAIASRSQEKADQFGEEFGAPRRFGSYEAMLADPEVQAVYISTPHPMHAEWAIKSAEAGKHILCEKPLTLDYPEAMAVVDAARKAGVFLMEAFMYRCNPQTAKLVELIREGVIGEVRLIEASFSFDAGYNLGGRLLNQALGGGGILDVGCYCASMARLIAGAALGRDWADPIEVKAVGHLGEESRVDEWATALLRFERDILAYVQTGVRLGHENQARIFGSQGRITVPSPWFCNGREPGAVKLIVQRYGEPETVVEIEVAQGIYSIEADTVAANIEAGQAPSPAMSWGDTLGNMQTLDRWRLGMDFYYDVERPWADFPTVDHRPLAKREDATMPYDRLPGLEKPVSRLVMGVMLGGATFSLPFASVMFDEYFRLGGNCFDTARIYGPSDAILGQWIKNRGIREEVVVLGKGAHTPNCFPESLTAELLTTLEQMQTDYLDIYMMHRDNLDVPVGEFIEVLNEHQKAGRIKVFGVSNWTLERIEEANNYAHNHGLTGLVALSNNLALAHMTDPVWGGCLHVSDPASRAWLEQHQFPVMSWSSTSRGFFVYGDPEDTSNTDLVRSWYSKDNFLRLERARELAKAKGVQPIQIALAWVLNQPFPTYALIGPHNLEELAVSVDAANLQLTPAELRWLALDD